MVLQKTYSAARILNKSIGPFKRLEEDVPEKGTWGLRYKAEQGLAGGR